MHQTKLLFHLPIDVSGSRRGSRYKFDAKGRRIDVTRGRGGQLGGGQRGARGGGHPRLAAARERYRRKFCGHGNQDTDENNQSRAKFGSKSR